MESVIKFNQLSQNFQSREDIQNLIQLAKSEEQNYIAQKLQNLLERYPDVERFDIDLQSLETEQIPLSYLGGVEYLPEIEDDETQGMGKAVSPDQIYQMITNKVIEMMKKTTGKSSTKPKWKKGDEISGFMVPFNFDTKKPYRGINILLLKGFEGYFKPFKNPYFMTFKQVEKHKGKVKKGAKGHEVVYFTKLYRFDGHYEGDKTIVKPFATYDERKIKAYIKKHFHLLPKYLKEAHNAYDYIPILKYYKVFNGIDIEGIDFKLDEIKIGKCLPENAPENIAANLIVKNYPNPPKIYFQGSEAFYMPIKDAIQVPKSKDFETINDFYRVLFHEMTHSTGHKKRLDRNLENKFGSKDYAKEELVAEFGAVFLSAQAGIVWYETLDHANYLKNWHNVLKATEDDTRFIMRAASAAQKASDYILDLNADGDPKFYKELLKMLEEPKKTKKYSDKDISDAFFNLFKNETDFLNDTFKKEWEQWKKGEVVFSSKEIFSDKKNRALFDIFVNEHSFYEKVFGSDQDTTFIRIFPTPKGRKYILDRLKSEGTTKDNKKKTKPGKQTNVFVLVSDEDSNNHAYYDAKDIKEVISKKKKNVILEDDRPKPKDFNNYINTSEFDYKAPNMRLKGIDTLKKIVAKDDLRPVLQCVLIEKDKYVATDAHKLIIAPRPKGDKLRLGNYNPKTKKYVDGKYPNYKTVIPTPICTSKVVDIDPILTHLHRYNYIIRKLGHSFSLIIVDFGGKYKNTVNSKLFFELLQAMKANGTKKIYFEFTDEKRAVLIKDSQEPKLMGLMMPFMQVYDDSDRNTFTDPITLEIDKDNGRPKGMNAPQLDLFSTMAMPTAQNSDTINFNKQILKAKHNGISDNISISLGKAKAPLSKFIGSKEIILKGKTIKKAMTKDDSHIMKWEDFINLPDFLNSPIAIFKSKSTGFVVLTKIINHKQKPVMTAIHFNRKLQINEIKSMYSRKNDNTYRDWIDDGLLIYIDEESDLLHRVFKWYNSTSCNKSLSESKATKKSVNRKKSEPKNENKGLNAPISVAEISVQPEIITETDQKTQSEIQENANFSQKTQKPQKPVHSNIKPITSIGQNESSFFQVNGEVGKFLQAVERKPVHSVVITMDGEQGAGKTTALYKFMDAFASAGNNCLFVSGEEHQDSSLAIEKRDKFLSEPAKQHISIVSEVESVEQLYDYINPFDIIFIDSWQKLLRMVGTIRLDEDLRKKFNGKVFVVIFQQTTTGRTKGGAEVVFDGDIIIKMAKENAFADNYAYFDKNRYTKVPIETLRYNIASGIVYNPEQETEEEDEDVIEVH